MNRTLATLALAAALAAPTAAFAQAAPPKPDKADKTATPAAPGARPGRQQGDPQVNRLRTITDQLALSADQKDKIKVLLDKATREVEETRLDYEGASRQELAGALRGVYDDLRTNIHDVLTEDQQKKFDTLSNQRGNGGQRGGGGQLQAVMGQLDLKDDQKAKIQTIMQESQDKMQEVRDAWRNGDRQAAREKGQALRTEMTTKITAVLTPEQQAKLKELMPNGIGGRGQGGRRGGN